jgi:hypothetical protein
MLTPEKTFLLRFTIQAELDDQDEEEDDDQYLKEWEGVLKPALIKAAFQSLRMHPGWEAFVRNRGISSEYEVEVVLTRRAAQP